MKNNLEKLEKKLKIKFKDSSLLLKSMTHKSYDPINSYEKLEFLGDRVLGLIISKKLLEVYPDEQEGILDKKLASLVNRKKCLEVAQFLNLDEFILISNSKKKIENKILSDSCEALIGAIYLDQGLKIVEIFILEFWSTHIKNSLVTFIDSKTKLQEYSLKKFKILPTYKLIDNSGPKHKPVFKIAVRLKNSDFVSAQGSSKKEAQQKAATLLLNKIGNK
tara:strand:+ start:76 stop:735 length:660 start_codon:yes stop_codon:yes gene_type:complete